MGTKVVIIGGGLGGLAAGLMLARHGFSVTILEQGRRPGGYSVKFFRSGYGFDLALHTVPAGGPGGDFSLLIDRLGLGSCIRFIRLSHGFLVRLGDWRFQIPNDYESLFESLRREFPDEQDGIVRLRRDLERCSDIYGPLLSGSESKWTSVPRFIPAAPMFLKHAAQPMSEYLARFIRDPALAAALFQPAVFPGIPSTEFPTVNFIMMSSMLWRKGMYTIAGGGQGLTDALSGAFSAAGGQILCGATACGVDVADGRVLSVTTTDGRRFEADAFVANVNTPSLVAMIGRERFPPKFLSALDALKPSLAVAQLHLGLDCSVRELGIHNHITMSFPDAAIDACIRRQREALFMEGFSITAPGIEDPRPQEKNESVLSVIGGVSADRWFSLGENEYRGMKVKAADDLIDRLDRMYPGLKGHVAVRDFATPRTFQRYAGNPRGAIMGFDSTCGMHRAIMTVTKFPFRNLVPANAWTDQLGGFLQCVRAGVRAAEKIIRLV